ncbi:hypothetical protein PV379_01210 [Streptomyces caniscabiei]|uniref:hypothetical protein n=1 Tax=Streptomyces caniscabiei TaxID=2746961 RepID=UPI0029ACCE2D|nr:hypothetical protein [Streptomyces caniscabiei]MDX2775972.1 hypothetical protein [Streptomyces caniscabiei]
MKNAILMLYGHYFNENGISHPWEEDIFRQPHELQELFHDHGMEFHVAIAAHPPSGLRSLGDAPEIRVAENPKYDPRTGRLVDAHFKRADIREYPGVIDHWVANFQDPVIQPDGSRQRTAYGLGLPNDRLWNCRPVQEMGNRKDHMDAILAEEGVGIPSYRTNELDMLRKHYGDTKVIYKPIDGSRGKGIEIFKTVTALKKALVRKDVAASGIVQPYLDLSHPIKGLIPANDDAARVLAKVNCTSDRVREIRMHVIATTDNGYVAVEAYPTLKYSHPGTPIMQVAGNVALDPSCISLGHPIHDTSTALAKAVLADAARRSGEPVSQYYGVFDWAIDKDGNAFVGDGNCRGPALSVEAMAAREAFCRLLVQSARRVLTKA